MDKYSGQDRRKYVRVPFKNNITYRICYNKFSSDEFNGDSQNIGGGGILFKTKWPPPTMSIIAIDINVNKLRSYIKEAKLENNFDLDNIYVQKGKIYGEVIRIKEYPESGYYDVALKFVRRKGRKK